MTREQDLEAIEAGRTATWLEGALAPVVDDMMRDRIDKMIAHYRMAATGKPLSHDLLVGLVGELTGLHDLLSELERRHRMGDAAAAREFGNG